MKKFFEVKGTLLLAPTVIELYFLKVSGAALAPIVTGLHWGFLYVCGATLAPGLFVIDLGVCGATLARDTIGFVFVL